MQTGIIQTKGKRMDTMHFDEAVQKRMSVRSFLDRPVEKSIIEEILNLALRSPSWGNTQSWELAVVGGEKVKALSNEFCEKLASGVLCESDVRMPEKFEGEYQDRYRAVGREVFRLKGIGREDQEARMNHYMNNFRAFGAPSLIYIMVDESLDTHYPLFDAGLLAAHICLAATSRGLGTCLLAALAWYPEVIRRHLGIGPEKKIVLGIALGYPNPDDDVNKLRSEREPLEKVAAWHGF